MASIDSLPPDQRAVLQLVLQRGRSYDEIAGMLSIDRAAVRQRALDALDTLSSSGEAEPSAERALVTDYLLGQLPERVAAQVHALLAASPADNEWARAVATELSGLAGARIAQVPELADGDHSDDAPPEDNLTAELGDIEYTTDADPAETAAEIAIELQAVEIRESEGSETQTAGDSHAAGLGAGSARRGSRRGGMILLSAVLGIIVIVVVVIVVASGSSSPKSGGASTTTGTGTGTGTSTTSTSKTSTTPTILAALNLKSPDGETKTVGVAQVVREDGTTGIVIDAQGVPANTKHNAYAVWLANSSGGSKFIGFVPNLVGKNGKLQTEGPLPSGAGKYNQLLVTLETVAHPKTPGTVVLEGPFRESTP